MAVVPSDSAAGSIPANAGEPANRSAASASSWVYPRERGGTAMVVAPVNHARGLSPRTRGNPPHRGEPDLDAGSIPANAGEPCWSRQSCAQSRVYPRERGGTHCRSRSSESATGLSPRTRGNHHDLAVFRHKAGSIPANAGEPIDDRGRLRSLRVYPRERGGTCHNPYAAACNTGLSPRTRGNPLASHDLVAHSGSIPANAGEPLLFARLVAHVQVYPRERGGTRNEVTGLSPLPGLSPRTRGNPGVAARPPAGAGSIPANAGEPTPIRRQPAQYRVYPRERGGTSVASNSRCAASGLSPRTRGNRQALVRAPGGHGSIPANAGEPLGRTRWRGIRGVYPRERGGTPGAISVEPLFKGLSPRTRGNRDPHPLLGRQPGSIPANAGEPRTTAVALASMGVYPRERGGTPGDLLFARHVTGLSPRTRGNPYVRAHGGRVTGSIPANAGEPHSVGRGYAPLGVYPRERGGTLLRRVGLQHRRGLSPRTRGNRHRRRTLFAWLGSIPANAGEPTSRREPHRRYQVYPRERGGTA